MALVASVALVAIQVGQVFQAIVVREYQAGLASAGTAASADTLVSLALVAIVAGLALVAILDLAVYQDLAINMQQQAQIQILL